MTAAVDGASLEVRYAEPALDLASVAECLAEAVPRQPLANGASHPSAMERARPLFEWRRETGTLVINSSGVLARLPAAKSYQMLEPVHDGFIRDAPVPQGNTRAYLGGRIVEGTGGRLQEALSLLAARVDDEIDALSAAGFDSAQLVQPAERALRVIGERVRQDPEAFTHVDTRVRRTVIAPVGSTQRSRTSEIGRLMAAVEEVDGDRVDHFERLASAVRVLLTDAGIADRAISTALEHHRQQAQRPGTQLSRFFDFLEDAALARVRLEVTFLMMEAIAAGSATRAPSPDRTLLATYISRAAGLFCVLTAPDGEDLSLNLSSLFGAEADFVLHDELIAAGFAGCLPVWPEWVTQVFERQQRGPGPHATAMREVSYRFRVNGIVPGDRQPAFVARLARIRRTLLGADRPAQALRGTRRSLAELVFLAAVIPADASADPSPEAALAEARRIASMLERVGADAIAATLDDLDTRAAGVEKISRALISILKLVGAAVTARVAGRTWDFYVNVRRSLVDLRRISFAVDTPLMIPADSPGRETMAFFRQIRVTADRPLPGHLFSLRVRVRLAEGALRSGETLTRASLARDLPGRWVQVAWCPESPTSPQGPAPIRPAAADPPRADGRLPHERWLVEPRVELRYQLRWLGMAEHREEKRALLAVHRCAFTMLAYTVLLRLLRRASQAATADDADTAAAERLAVSLFRVQRGGRGSEPYSGEQGLFAAAHAVETALARDFDVRMQGLVVDEAEDVDGGSDEEKDRGLYGALFGGLPAVIQRTGDGELEPRVGLVTYGLRPCNGHPERPGQREATLCVAHTYVAHAVAAPFRGYRVAAGAVRCEVRDDPHEHELPAVVVEAVRELHEREGCRHILVLSHRYGTRRIGWTAARLHAPELPRVLADVAVRFPDLYLYPVVRDTFPVTRLRERLSDEDAFEILRPDEHVEAYPTEARELRHAYTPVYSVATLHVVGRAAKPQSGFCTYFLLRDRGAGSIEAAEQVRANLLLPSSPVRADLIALLRGVHYLESERPATEERTLQPVLDPYSWLQPETIGHAGEIVVGSARRRSGAVVISLPAVLERVSRVLHARPEPIR